jgi:MYXO-CTERM domain-containing protein
MKRICMIALTTGLLVGTAGLSSAQTTAPGTPAGGARTEARDDGRGYWGLLGLLGLAGLAGLRRRRDDGIRGTTTGTMGR